MWINKKEYEKAMTRISALESAAYDASKNRDSFIEQYKKLRQELVMLESQFMLLLNSLGLVYHRTPSKEEYVKKGGPERG